MKDKINKSIINEIKELTYYNNHNKNRLLLAKHLKLTNFIKGYKSIIFLHSITNDMRMLKDIRHHLDKSLFRYAKNKISNFNELYKVF